MNKKLGWLLVVSAAVAATMMTPAVAQDASRSPLHEAGVVMGARVITVFTGRKPWHLHRPNAAQIAAARWRGACWWYSYYDWGDCPPGYRPYALTTYRRL